MEYEIGSNEEVTEAVVLAVSAIRGLDPLALPALDEVVDPESLDSLFDSRSDGAPRKGGRVAFTYADCFVRMDNAEFIEIEPIGPDRSQPERFDTVSENID